MKVSLLIGSILAILIAGNASAQFITIRLSYKAVLSPENGLRSSNFTDSEIDQAIAEMNQLQSSYGRGYRFERVGSISDIGGNGDFSGPSRWYDTDFFDPDHGGEWKDEMEDAAVSDARYHWRNDAVNIYITDGISGGICSFYSEGDQIVVVSGGSSVVRHKSCNV